MAALKALRYLAEFGPVSTARKIGSVLTAPFIRPFMRRAGSGLPVGGRVSRVDTAQMAPDYAVYIEQQIARSLPRSSYAIPIRGIGGSRDQLIRQLSRVAREWNVSPRAALSVGTRDDRELMTIRRILKCGDVTGVDLFSASPHIRAADMHDLPFESASFDVAVAIHSIEHSYDPERSLGELVRVTRPGGLLAVEVPVNFEPTDVDRVDFGGVAQILARFPGGSVALVWAHLENRSAAGRSPTLRLILLRTGQA